MGSKQVVVVGLRAGANGREYATVVAGQPAQSRGDFQVKGLDYAALLNKPVPAGTFDALPNLPVLCDVVYDVRYAKGEEYTVISSLTPVPVVQ